MALALAAAALAAAAAVPAGGGTATWLRITYREDASHSAPDARWTLRCKPPRGTLPRPKRACRRLAAGGAKLFAPVPPDAVCTDIYGGPQKARIVGVVAGKPIRTTVTRTNGCEIARWNRLSPWLLPPGGATR